MTKIKIVIAGVFALLAATTAFAQTQTDMQILAEKLRADKKLLVATNMELTETEAAKFWPIYDEYQVALASINAHIGGMISEYAAAYNKGEGHIPEELSARLVKGMLESKAAEVELQIAEHPRCGEQARVGAALELADRLEADPGPEGRRDPSHGVRRVEPGGCEVVPLVGVGLVVVELVAAIGVADVAPVLVADGMVVRAQGGDGDVVPIRFRVFEERLEAESFELGIRRQSAEVDEGRVEAE